MGEWFRNEDQLVPSEELAKKTASGPGVGRLIGQKTLQDIIGYDDFAVELPGFSEDEHEDSSDAQCVYEPIRGEF